jgi:glycine cleavage system H protein
MVPAMQVPDDRRYTTDHEWARLADGNVQVGITDYAQDALGDIVYVDLPAVGAKFEVGGVLGEVESTKSVSEIYAPIAGEVVAVNTALADNPELLNTDPYGAGWISNIAPADPVALDALLDAAGYTALISE